jgi:hypothetical protein
LHRDSKEIEFDAANRREVYDWMTGALCEHEYGNKLRRISTAGDGPTRPFGVAPGSSVQPSETRLKRGPTIKDFQRAAHPLPA